VSAAENFPEGLLPAGIRSRFVADVNGLNVHILEAGEVGRPMLLLVHGFPELAFSWRRVMPALADAGYYVVAPDLRGFGRTTGGADGYDCDLNTYGSLAKVADAHGLVRALGYDQVAAVVGHDLGSPVAAYCALLRPDVFRSVVLMSAPFAGLPSAASHGRLNALADDLAALPRPRKSYILWNATREAAADYDNAPQGLHDFFRAYFHSKSADWAGNRPVKLKAQTAEEMAQIPTYYVMDRHKGMAETMLDYRPTPQEIAACRWMSEDEMAFFAAEYGRTGFQGPLNAAYRPRTEMRNLVELKAFEGRRIDVPSCFMGGDRDWGLYQTAGLLEAMPVSGCSRLLGAHIVEGAGHWVQQEQAEAVTGIVLEFLREVAIEDRRSSPDGRPEGLRYGRH
jgi:pimeloyl-ACP methyl ester carboxylesterase